MANLKPIPVSEIQTNPYDERREKDLLSDESYQDFIQSVKEHGVIMPIRLVAVNQHYEVIDGDRRLKVAKQLGAETIPAIVETKEISEEQHRIDAYIANTFRKELQDMEKAYSIRDIYKAAGYSLPQVKTGINILRSNNYDSRKKTPEEFLNSVESKYETIKGSINGVDKKFVETCNSIGDRPNTQYNLLRLVMNMSEEVLAYTEKLGLSRHKKIMISHTKLQKHPKLQRQLAQNIKDKDETTARYKVAQTVRDLETGYMNKTQKGEYTMGYSTRPDDIRKKEFENDPSMVELTVGGLTKQLIYRLTDTKITGLLTYDKISKIIKETKKRRITIAKQMGERALSNLQDEMLLIQDLSRDMLDTIDQEIDSRGKNKQLLKP